MSNDTSVVEHDHCEGQNCFFCRAAALKHAKSCICIHCVSNRTVAKPAIVMGCTYCPIMCRDNKPVEKAIGNSFDPVDRPSHYIAENVEVFPVQQWEVLLPAKIRAAVERIDISDALGFDKNANRYCSFKYIWRAGAKGDTTEETIQDLKKAKWYIDREIDKLQGELNASNENSNQQEAAD